MRIDAHQHFWKLDRGDYEWIYRDRPVLQRDYLPEHLAPHLRKHHIDGTILVQAIQTLEETEFLLSLGESSDRIVGVVGWLDLNDPAYKNQFERFRKHRKFVGFRIMIQQMRDPSVILEPHYIEALRYFTECDFPVDLLVRHHQLPVLIEALVRVPGLRGVVNHLAKPPIKDQVVEPWKSRMRAVAKHPNIYCKMSGLISEADRLHWKQEHFLEYVRHVLELFGPERVMFGSDWPVCLHAAGYDEVMDVLLKALPPDYAPQNRERLFGLNARIFYKLQDLRDTTRDVTSISNI